jgi:hypothetical protein
MNKLIIDFKKKHCNDSIEAVIFFSYYKCTVFSIHIEYQEEPNLLSAIFTIDKNKKDVIRTRIKDKKRCQNYTTEIDKKSSDVIYSYFINDIKKIIRQKKVIFEFFEKFQKFIIRLERTKRHLKNYKEISYLKKNHSILSDFHTIFKKENVLDLYKFIDENYKEKEKNKYKYKLIPISIFEVGEKELMFCNNEIKIFNYKKNNEYYIYNSKLITKKTMLSILSTTIKYNNNIVKSSKELPFKKNTSKVYFNFKIISEFINPKIIKKKINDF